MESAAFQTVLFWRTEDNARLVILLYCIWGVAIEIAQTLKQPIKRGEWAIHKGDNCGPQDHYMTAASDSERVPSVVRFDL